MSILEDELEDILGKAQRGQAGTPNISSFSSNEQELQILANKLNLSYTALLNLQKPFPHTPLPPEVEMITAPFGHLGVNCFTVQTDSYNLLIDTGTDPNLVAHFPADLLLITHEHPDHTACSSSFDCPIITARNTSTLDSYSIQTFDVSGHYTPSVAYYFPALATPTCFVGDSLFRRSMGGCRGNKNYQLALKNVREMLQTLPSETILCVGHGPNTTVAEELKENPFFAI